MGNQSFMHFSGIALPTCTVLNRNMNVYYYSSNYKNNECMFHFTLREKINQLQSIKSKYSQVENYELISIVNLCTVSPLTSDCYY